MNIKKKIKLYKYQILILTIISCLLSITLNSFCSYTINSIIPLYPDFLIKLENIISSFINGYEIIGLIIVLVLFLITRWSKNRQKGKSESILIKVIILSLYFILINFLIYFYYPIYPTIPTNDIAFNYKLSQQFLDKYNRKLKKNNPDIKFSISTIKNKYFIGEVIEIEMLFKNISKNEYQITNRSYDRSGRMSEVEFYGDGSDGLCEDPRGLYSCFSGGMGTCEKVTENKRKFLLNKWIVFRKPGKYYIYSSNSLVADHKNLTPNIIKLNYLTSNILELNIVTPPERFTSRLISNALIKINHYDEKIKERGFLELGFIANDEAFLELLSYPNNMQHQLICAIAHKNWDFIRKTLISLLDNNSFELDKGYLFTLSYVSTPKEIMDKYFEKFKELASSEDFENIKNKYILLWEEVEEIKNKYKKQMYDKIKNHPRMKKE